MAEDLTVNVLDLVTRYPFTLDSIEATWARIRAGGGFTEGGVSRWAQFCSGKVYAETALAVCEGWRLIYGLYDSDVPRVPVDVFCYEFQERPEVPLPVTKTGGRPWRRDEKPWPRREDGQPLAFIGQIRMTESRDLIPERLRGAVGDLVLVFSDFTEPRFPQYTQDFATMSVMEWSSLSDVPSGRSLAAELEAVLYPYCFRARRCRTVEFNKQAGVEYISRRNAQWSGRTAIESIQPQGVLQYRGTKVGGNPQRPYYFGSQSHFDYLQKRNLTLPPRLIDAPWFASLGSVPPDIDGAVDADPYIAWGDGGYISLFMEADGQMYGEEHGQG